MPAAYAHHKFGEMCLETMPPRLNAVCTRYRELFDIGVHGPDILFYYEPLGSNKVNQLGQEIHRWTGKKFFEECRKPYQEYQEQRNAMMAYLLGFLAHFLLDSSCHDLVNEEAAESELSHNQIESEYEVYLMEKDRVNPLKHDRSETLHPTQRNARIISRFFPFSEEEILKSLKGQRRILHLFYSPAEKKKKMIRKAVRFLKIKGDFGDLFLDQTESDHDDILNEILFTRQETAAMLYPELADNLVHYLYDRGELEEYFDYDFEGILHRDTEES